MRDSDLLWIIGILAFLFVVGSVVLAAIKFGDAREKVHVAAVLNNTMPGLYLFKGKVPPLIIDLKSPKKMANQKPGKVNVNTADAKELEKLPRIGPVLAERIIEYRRRNGPFKGPEDLLKVKGIGEKTLERILPYIEF